MKTSLILALAALSLGCVASVNAAGPAFDEAVRVASRDSKAGLDAICDATYKAVKESPDEADKVFEAVLGQRADWKASEVYAIFRSVLLARPDLSVEIGTLVANHSKKGKNGTDVNDASDSANEEEGATPDGLALVGAVGNTEEMSPMLSRLVNVLYDATLPAGVAEEGLNMVIAAIAGSYGYAYQGSFTHIGDNTSMDGPSLDSVLEIIPTPAPVTGN